MPAVGWSYGPPQRPEILSAKPNPAELMHAVRRRWPLAIGVGTAVGVVAATLVWFLVPIKYEVTALLRVKERPGYVLHKSSDGGDAFTIYKRTQIQYMLSGMVLNRTVVDPEHRAAANHQGPQRGSGFVAEEPVDSGLSR